MEMINTLVPELAGAEPGRLRAAKLPQLRYVIQIGGPKYAGTIAFDEVARMGGTRHREQLATLAETCNSTMRSTSSSPAARRVRPKVPRSPTTTS